MTYGINHNGDFWHPERDIYTWAGSLHTEETKVNWQPQMVFPFFYYIKPYDVWSESNY